MIAPLESCTVPEIVPLITWAKVDGMKVLMTADVSRHAKTKGIRKKFDFRIFSCVVVLSLINFSNFTTLLSLSPKTLRLWRLFRRKPMAAKGITSPHDLFQSKRRTGMESKKILDDSVDFLQAGRYACQLGYLYF
jgi:hypothetical protein